MEFLVRIENIYGSVLDDMIFETKTWDGAIGIADAFRDEVEMHSTPQHSGERFVIRLTRTDKYGEMFDLIKRGEKWVDC